MKLLWQAVVGSVLVHLVYGMTAFLVDYVKTMMYQPNIEALFGNDQVLQSEVAFGYALSPFWYVASFFLATMMLWGLLFMYKKVASKPSW